MPQKPFESPDKVVVGRKYDVPTVRTDYPIDGYSVFPVIPQDHIDGREICVKPVDAHYHIDYRFIDLPKRDYVLRKDSVSYLYWNQFTAIRESSTFQVYLPFTVAALHEKFKNTQIKNRICPHKGMKLVNSCGTCPGHGLVWDETGHLTYKPPFFIELADGAGIGEIKGSRCDIELKKDVIGEMSYRLLDSTGREYPLGNGTNFGSYLGREGEKLTLTVTDC